MIPPRRNSTRQISHRITIPLLLALRLSHLLLIYPNFHYENHLCYTITNPIHDPTQKEFHATNISPQHNSNKNPGRYSFSNFKHRTKIHGWSPYKSKTSCMQRRGSRWRKRDRLGRPLARVCSSRGYSLSLVAAVSRAKGDIHGHSA